jgi:hypothetical protein
MGGKGVGVCCFLVRVLLGVVMASLMYELAQAVAIAWLCFGFGVLMFQMGCRDRHCRILSRGLLFLSPFVLTCFGVHATRENQQLAAILAAKKSEGVSGRIYLASVTTADYGDGYSLEIERYSDGTTKATGRMPDAGGRITRSDGGMQAGNETRTGTSGSMVPLSSWHGSVSDQWHESGSL